jgi:hypothetical protein
MLTSVVPSVSCSQSHGPTLPCSRDLQDSDCCQPLATLCEWVPFVREARCAGERRQLLFPCINTVYGVLPRHFLASQHKTVPDMMSPN